MRRALGKADMEGWDAEYIHNQFTGVHTRLDNLQKTISAQTHLLERQLNALSQEISDLKKQGVNGSIKIGVAGGSIAGLIVELFSQMGS